MLGIEYTPGPLTDPTVERLAAILRASGTRASNAPGGATVIRWRPETTDPALALLLLAADHPEVFVIPGDSGRLLDESLEARLGAAVDLEAVWLAERSAVPLFTSERWVVAAPNVRGVRVRADGIPLLHDAYIARDP